MNFKKNKNIGGIFLDLQKAFYCVNHDILLNKLKSYGIAGGFFKLIKNLPTGQIPEGCFK